MSMHAARCGAVLLSCVLAQVLWAVPVVRYVDAAAPAGGNGVSWTVAYRNLQDALTYARTLPATQEVELRVAKGRYTPDRGSGFTVGDRAASFVLRNRTIIAGGYRGAYDGTGLSADDRDAAVFRSVLSGDLANNDDADANGVPDYSDPAGYGAPSYGSFLHYGDNSLVVLTALSAVSDDQTSGLDGLWVRGGNNYQGPIGFGGGLFCNGGRLFIQGCRFEYNQADSGGAMAVVGTGLARVMSSRFDSNTAQVAGAVTSEQSGEVVIDASTFESNLSYSGGALGVGYYYFAGRATVRGTTFNGNIAVANSSFAGGGGAVLNNSQDGILLRDCLFENNKTGFGTPSRARGGALMLYRETSVLGCTFVSNQALGDGGAVCMEGFLSDAVNMFNCDFFGNSTGADGGAIRQITDDLFPSEVEIANCVFSGNTAADSGGALAAETAYIDSCTIAGNAAAICGGLYVPGFYGPFVNNSILHGNTDPASPLEQKQLALGAFSYVTPDHNLVQGWSGVYGGAGNFDGNPSFKDALGPDGVVGTEDDDLRLRSTSVAVDAGSDANLPFDVLDLDADSDTSEPLPVDLDGSLRISGARVDCGAYEFVAATVCVADINGDGVVDFADYLEFLNLFDSLDPLADINGDGVVDFGDYLEFLNYFDAGC